jgi:hypothetical protein
VSADTVNRDPQTAGAVTQEQKMTNPQSQAAYEVKAAHRIACLDAILAAELNVTTIGGILDWLDRVMEGRTVVEVVELAAARQLQHLAWPAPGQAS